MSDTTPERPRKLRRALVIGSIRLVSDGPLLWFLLFLHFQPAGSGGIAAAASNAALFVGFAAIHSSLARDRPKRLLRELVGGAWVRPTFVATSGFSLAAVLALWQPLAGELWHADGSAYWMLTLLYIASLAGMAWSATYIDYAEFLGIRGLLRSPRAGRAKDPAFSVRGPYAYCRHPMYAFLLLALWVAPVMTSGRLELAALASSYLLVGTMLEERNLRAELGEVYDLYRANVPMWVPRLTPWHQRGPADEAAQM